MCMLTLTLLVYFFFLFCIDFEGGGEHKITRELTLTLNLLRTELQIRSHLKSKSTPVSPQRLVTAVQCTFVNAVGNTRVFLQCRQNNHPRVGNDKCNDNLFNTLGRDTSYLMS